MYPVIEKSVGFNLKLKMYISFQQRSMLQLARIRNSIYSCAQIGFSDKNIETNLQFTQKKPMQTYYYIIYIPFLESLKCLLQSYSSFFDTMFLGCTYAPPAQYELNDDYFKVATMANLMYHMRRLQISH